MDGHNTYPEDQGYARLQALKYLDRASRNELVAVYALDNTLRVLQEFTDDRVALRRSIDTYKMALSIDLPDQPITGLLTGITGNGANAIRANAMQRRADITTAAFEALARHLTGLPGRKKLIWITAALPLTFTQENERNGTLKTEFTNMSAKFFAPMRLLNDANVAIYPIDPRGVTGHLDDPGIGTMNELASMTGGKAFYNDNDISVGIEEAFADTDLTYTLGYYPVEVVEGPHSISVKVARSGTDLRYRKSYTAEAATKPLTKKFLAGTLSAWVNQPLESTEIPIQAAATPAINKPGYYDVEVAIDISALQLAQKDGRFTGAFEIAIVPDVENRPKGLNQVIKVNLTIVEGDGERRYGHQSNTSDQQQRQAALRQAALGGDGPSDWQDRLRADSA
jgi:VWFA-related protein